MWWASTYLGLFFIIVCYFTFLGPGAEPQYPLLLLTGGGWGAKPHIKSNFTIKIWGLRGQSPPYYSIFNKKYSEKSSE